MMKSSSAVTPRSTVQTLPAQTRSTSRRRLVDPRHWWNQGWDITCFAAALTFLTISLPGREGGDADLIGIAKIAIRLLALGWFAMDIFVAWGTDFRRWSQERSPNGSNLATPRRLPRGGRIPHFANWLLNGSWRSTILWPWLVFAGWSLVTIVWSPLKGFSIGQWLGLAALLLLSNSVALRYRHCFSKTLDESRGTAVDWRRLMVSLQMILSAYCLMIVTVYCISPDSSGLNREILHTGGAGLIHPTAAGATAAIAILIGALVWLLKLNRRPWLTAATMPANLALLILSTSRGSMLMLTISLGIAIIFLSTRRQRGMSLTAMGILLLVVMAMSPGSQWLGNKFDSVTTYVMRGQSTDDLKQVSGRSEMWAAIWNQFEDSPLIGHGYYVTSRTGELYVWGRVANHDAHNIFLQSLVSGGIVGGLLLLWALYRLGISFAQDVFKRIRRKRKTSVSSHADFLWCVGLVGLWYVGWSQTCTTFLGPIRPESVVFFTLLGLFAAKQDAILIHRETLS